MKKILFLLIFVFAFSTLWGEGESSSPELDEGHAENSPLYWGNPSDANNNLDYSDELIAE